MSYIIKNCPACRDYDVFGKDNEGCCYLYNDYCIKKEDCILKQIVDKCKAELGIKRTIGKDVMAQEILQILLEQEV